MARQGMQRTITTGQRNYGIIAVDSETLESGPSEQRGIDLET
jgi:hypothetical protein